VPSSGGSLWPASGGAGGVWGIDVDLAGLPSRGSSKSVGVCAGAGDAVAIGGGESFGAARLQPVYANPKTIIRNNIMARKMHIPFRALAEN